ncbi:MAG: amino acid permease [Archangium sp.]|nr:amino acid permease [Archangium sp.]
MAADDELEALGYKQELLRDMGGFQNFALSFSIISILTGAVTLYGAGLTSGGPRVMLLGWPLVAFFTIAIGLSLGELASAFPTAGALYHWSSILGGPGAGWATAWLNVLGQFAITAAIDFGLAEFLAPLLGLDGERAHVLMLYAALLLSHAVLNHVGVKVVAALNTVSAWYHVIGVIVLVGAVMFFAKKQPLPFLLQDAPPLKDAVMPGFLAGLLQAAWTFTGYDASAHASEETKDAARNAPKGILLAIIASAIAGYVMLIVITLAIGDLPATLAAKNPFIFVLEGALGGLGTALVWVAVGAMWFCGLASITSNSRMLYAFARDGGLPFSYLLARVSPRWQTPHVGVWVSACVAFALALFASALSVMAALSTVALYASYGLPVFLALLARRKGWPRTGPWTLGKYGAAINVVAVVWIVFMVVVMSLPPNGLAGITFGSTCALLLVVWFGGMRKYFAGPVLPKLS